MNANTKLGVNAAIAAIGFLLALSHSHTVSLLGYFIGLLCLVALLHLQLAGKSLHLKFSYGVLVIGLILQISGRVLHSYEMNRVGTLVFLIGWLIVLCMMLVSRVGNYQPRDPIE